MTKSGISEKYGVWLCQHSPADLHVHCRNIQDWQMYCAICPSPAWRSLIDVESSHFIQTGLPFEKRGCIWEEPVTSGRQVWEVSYLHFSDGVPINGGAKKPHSKPLKKPVQEWSRSTENKTNYGIIFPFLRIILSIWWKKVIPSAGLWSMSKGKVLKYKDSWDEQWLNSTFCCEPHNQVISSVYMQCQLTLYLVSR